MKKYVAIGHWDFSRNITCTAGDAKNMSEFKADLRGNGFTAYIIFSEQKISEYKAADIFGKLDMISNKNRHAIDIQDYMHDCIDIIDSKLAAI